MQDDGTAGPAPGHQRRGNRVLRPMVGILTIVAFAAGAGAVGALPGIFARKTFLAPQPDAGMGDLGPALFAVPIGLAGVAIGAALGCVFAVRYFS